MNRIASLDTLRSLAIILVLGRHLLPVPPGSPPLLVAFTSTWTRGGWVGVDLFFVLSGFLVSGLIFREHLALGQVKVGRFLVRRAFKIYPPLWLLTLFAITLSLSNGSPIETSRVAAELLFVQNYFPCLWPHTWSLAIEEHFYLTLAFASAILIRSRRSRPFSPLPWLVAITLLVCPLLRATSNLGQPYSHESHLFPTHLRIDSLAFGTLIAYLFHFHPKTFQTLRPFRQALAVLGLTLLAIPFLTPLETSRYMPVFGFTTSYLGAGALLMASLHTAPTTTFLSQLSATVGRHSYSIYLWHIPVSYFCLKFAPNYQSHPLSWLAHATTYLLGSILLGTLISITTEAPILKLRDRLIPSSSSPNPPTYPHHHTHL